MSSVAMDHLQFEDNRTELQTWCVSCLCTPPFSLDQSIRTGRKTNLRSMVAHSFGIWMIILRVGHTRRCFNRLVVGQDVRNLWFVQWNLRRYQSFVISLVQFHSPAFTWKGLALRQVYNSVCNIFPYLLQKHTSPYRNGEFTYPLLIYTSPEIAVLMLGGVPVIRGL